jgi:hypothetical protein
MRPQRSSLDSRIPDLVASLTDVHPLPSMAPMALSPMPSDRPARSSFPTCYNCGQTGHRAIFCTRPTSKFP